MSIRSWPIILFCLFTGIDLPAQTTEPLRVEPPHWWTNMPENELMITLHETGIGTWTPEIREKSVRLKEVHPCSNPNYLFLTITWDAVFKPGTISIRLRKDGQIREIPYTFKGRDLTFRPGGLQPADAIYLITPDRFANGDPSNDVVEGMYQTTLDRQDGMARHGGDLQGIINHLDHIQSLGMTALWLNPIDENNEHKESYHGYAITDHFAVDPRLGDTATYRQLVETSRKKGLKMVKDVVYNHFGDKHHLIRDLPFPEWVHGTEYHPCNFRATTLMDPYASEYDRTMFNEGWFDDHMPDMNQQDPLLARYLMQHTWWWIEEYHLDALRIDTYAYPDPDFMDRLVKETQAAYPGIFIFAETWVHSPAIQSWFMGQSQLNRKVTRALNSVTDFQLYNALQAAFHEEPGWTTGISRLYYAMAQDFLNPNAANVVTFMDNHDVARYFGVVDRDYRKFKAALSILATTRGIPCLYYGSEVLMKETANHGVIRQDFPGGWPADKKNKFTREGRSRQENDAFNLIQRLFTWRAKTPAITKGTLTQFLPIDGHYTYFRRYGESLVMVTVNGNAKAREFSLDRFGEFTKGYRQARDVVSGKIYPLDRSWFMEAYESRVLELER